MVRARSDAANTRHNTRQFLDRPAFTEPLKAPQFRDLKVDILDFALIV
jgi:hypothetical protein